MLTKVELPIRTSASTYPDIESHISPMYWHFGSSIVALKYSTDREWEHVKSVPKIMKKKFIAPLLNIELF